MKWAQRIFFFIVAAGVLMAPQTSQVNTYVNGNVLTADQLNAEFGNLYSTINALDEDNFLDTTSFSATFLNAAAAGDGIGRDAGTGVMEVNVDDSSIEINADTLRVKASGITSSMILNGTVAGGDLSTSLVINASAGTASLPTYSFNGDENTGVYAPAADQIGFAAAGGLVAMVSASGFSADGGSTSWKSKAYTGSLSASTTLDLTPGGTVIGAFGYTETNGSGGGPMDTTNSFSTGATCEADTSAAICFSATNGSSTTVRIINRDSDSTNDYGVIIFYQ